MRAADRAFGLAAWAATLAVAAGAGTLFVYLFVHGLPALSLSLFFGDVSPVEAIFEGAAVWEGLWPATVGTLRLVGLSLGFAFPVGLAGGAYLAHFALGRTKMILSLAVDLLASLPSILVGLFGFALILFLRSTLLPEAKSCLLLAAGCIALLVLPYVVRTTEQAIEALPEGVKATGPALGFGPTATLLRILLPAASRRLWGGAALATGRAAEDTAVILLTGVVANAGIPASLFEKFEALPFTVYFLAAEYRDAAELARANGAALVLVLVATALIGGARLVGHAVGAGEGRP